MQTEYRTERRTIVTTNPIGRPRKRPGDPKSPYARRPVAEAPAAPKPEWQGKIELIGDGDSVFIDGIVPRAFGEAVKAMFDALT